MSKRKRTPSATPAPPQAGSRGTESILRDIHRLLASRELDSPEEVDAFLSAALHDGRVPVAESTTPFDRAVDLVFEALESDDPTHRAALARQALEISPDVGDAYNILAEDLPEAHLALPLYREGMAAAERAVGGEFAALMEEGELWMTLEARPYMRARLGAAEAMWEMGDRVAAIAEGWELLRLNQNDNQGVRHVLLHWLLQAGSIAAIDTLLARYEGDDSAHWHFGTALHRFRTEGASPRADAALDAGVDANPHVAPFLLLMKELPGWSPDYVGIGEESEAVAYAEEALSLWWNTPGAIDWLGTRHDLGRKRRPTQGRRTRRNAR
ncbi:MAG TPA: hypothetical protein VEA99_16665 [Gemmatimonadaceae bacterium]|nr:hypothetical protein [Gemmatimonadaceae bacterium]